MNSDSTDSEIRRFYGKASIPGSRLDAMLDHGRTAASVSRWKRIAGTSLVTVVLTSVACGYLLIRLDHSQRALTIAQAELRKPEEVTERPWPFGSGRDEEFQLVAVRHHGDRCPVCRAAGETFASLKLELSDAPVNFTLVDLREEGNEVNAAIDRFGMHSLVDDRQHKVLVALRSPSGELTELDLNDQESSVSDQIARIIEENKNE